MAETKPCPFCGKPVYMSFSTKSGAFEVQHMFEKDDKSCSTIMPIRIQAVNLMEARERWNRRVNNGDCEFCNHQFGRNLREARLAKGLSVKELAKAAFTTASACYGYESGHMKPGVETLQRLCEVLGVTEEFLRGKTDG